MSEEYKPKHGDLVFLSYMHNREIKTARAVTYRGRYLGIEINTKRINDPSVNLFEIYENTVEEVNPLEDQPHGPTDLEESVKMAMIHSDKYINIRMGLKVK